MRPCRSPGLWQKSRFVSIFRPMALRKLATFWVTAALVSGCAADQQQTPRASLPTTAAQIQSTESVAFECEREINSAERELKALNPDQAVKHLDAAKTVLYDQKIEAYPDVKQLRERHAELTDRVPLVREEVRKRELATAVKAAKGKIDETRAALKDAVAAAKRKDAEEADLKRAGEAVQLVETALDEHSKLESQDPEYAKYSLAAQKELAERKKLLEQRTVEVAVRNQRAKVEESRKLLADAMSRLKSPDVTEPELEAAGAAAQAVSKVLDEGAPLAAKDQTYSTWAANIRKNVDENTARIGTRRIEVAVAKHKKEIAAARSVLSEALKRLSAKDPQEAEFESAKTALSGVEKILDGTDLLTAKDRAFAKYVIDARKTLPPARTGIEKRKLEVDVSKQRAQIAAARAVLSDALKRLKEKEPPETDFEAASNAASAVEKTLDGAEPLTAKDRELSKYVIDVRKFLSPARSEIERRRTEVEIGRQKVKVDQALAAVKQNIQRLDTEVDCNAAEASVTDLQKALDEGEKYSAQNPGYSKYAIQSLKLLTAARTKIQGRRDQIAYDTQRARVDDELKALKDTLGVLNGFSPGEDGFKAVADAVEKLKKTLDDGVGLEKKFPKYETFAATARKVAHEAGARIDKRKGEIEVRERRMLVEDAVATAKSRVDTVKKADATNEEVTQALDALKAAREELVKGVVLEKKDRSYEELAGAARKKLDALQEHVNKVKHEIAFRAGPLADLSAGINAAETAEALSPDGQKKAYNEALDYFRKCQKEGSAILADHPRLAGANFPVGKKKAKGADILKMCSERAKKVEAKLTAAGSATASR